MGISRNQIRWWEFAPSWRNQMVAKFLEVPHVYMVGMHEKTMYVLKDHDADPEPIKEEYATRVYKIMSSQLGKIDLVADQMVSVV